MAIKQEVIRTAYLYLTLNLSEGHGKIHAHIDVEYLGKVEG